MKIFRLYGTSACHLCELAEGMIAAQSAGIGSVEVERVDISSTDALFQRYGLVIPVLQHPDGRELYWPFAAQQLDAFLRS
jgi:hypothetical protein